MPNKNAKTRDSTQIKAQSRTLDARSQNQRPINDSPSRPMKEEIKRITHVQLKAGDSDDLGTDNKAAELDTSKHLNLNV